MADTHKMPVCGCGNAPEGAPGWSGGCSAGCMAPAPPADTLHDRITAELDRPAVAKIRVLKQALRAINDRHQPRARDRCRWCDDPYPCPDIRDVAAAVGIEVG